MQFPSIKAAIEVFNENRKRQSRLQLSLHEYSSYFEVIFLKLVHSTIKNRQNDPQSISRQWVKFSLNFEFDHENPTSINFIGRDKTL